MVLCIIPSNFRIIAEILKKLEWEPHLGQTDGQRDGRTQLPTIIPVGPMMAEGKNVSLIDIIPSY